MSSGVILPSWSIDMIDSQPKLNQERGRHKPLSRIHLDRIVSRIRVRLAGSDANGGIVPLDRDIALLQSLESNLAGWIDAIKEVPASESLTDQGISASVSTQMRLFHEHGGHTARYTNEQQQYIAQNGAIAFIELEVKKDLFVVVGAVTGFCQNPYTDAEGNDGKPRNEDGFFRDFPQFDLRDVGVIPARKIDVLTAAPKSFLTARSSILPVIEGDFITNQLQGEELPQEFMGQPLRRMGLAGRAKAVLFLIADAFKQTQYVTSNIASIFKQGDPLELENKPSRNFNHWMEFLGWREHFRKDLTSNPKIYIAIRAYMGKLSSGLDALIGKRGIATGKGHDIACIQKEAEKGSQFLLESIKKGDHQPWSAT